MKANHIALMNVYMQYFLKSNQTEALFTKTEKNNQ